MSVITGDSGLDKQSRSLRCPCFIQTLCCVKVLKTVYVQYFVQMTVSVWSAWQYTQLNFDCLLTAGFTLRWTLAPTSVPSLLCLKICIRRFQCFSGAHCALHIHDIPGACGCMALVVNMDLANSSYETERSSGQSCSQRYEEDEKLRWVLVIVYSLLWWYFYC